MLAIAWSKALLSSVTAGFYNLRSLGHGIAIDAAWLLRLLASFCKRCYSIGKSRKPDDNVIGNLRTRIEVIWEIKVNQFQALGFSILQVDSEFFLLVR